MAIRPRSISIRQFIVQEVDRHPGDIAGVVAAHFQISTQSARKHLHALEDEGVLISSGRTRGKTYALKLLAHVKLTYQTRGLQEDRVWTNDFSPLIQSVPSNVSTLCTIAFEEMLNNAIDHSGSDEIIIEMKFTAAMIAVSIWDRGIGIFKKITDVMKLPEERMALLELSKGKMTTSPENHTGMGIFFTSRMVDIFTIRSGNLLFGHIQPEQDWLNETGEVCVGTCVEFTLSTSTERTAAEVYNRFCSDPNDDDPNNMAFRTTHVPIRLAQFDGDPLVSRSQAKRVLARFEKFAEVIIDFQGVELIGQGFADELFRVFPSKHPNIKVVAINANRQVDQMIRLARDQANSPHQKKNE